MKRGAELEAAIQAAPLLAQTTIAYRVTNLSYFETLTSTEGAYKSDNRFTAKGLSAALYVADAPDLALREATQGYQDEFRAPEIPAHAFYPVHFQATRLLDLTNLDVQEALDVSLMTLTGDWKSSLALHARDARSRVETHELGEAAFRLGLEGLRYPSAFDGLRHNYVLFTEHLASPPTINLPQIIVTAQTLLKQQSDLRE